VALAADKAVAPADVAPTPAADPAADPTTKPTSDPVPAPAPTAPPSRLLEKLAAGHFNPVAALRLMVNHAEEIKAAGLAVGAPERVGHGRGYERALAAYRAMMEAEKKPAAVEPTPVMPEPAAPEPSGPAPVEPAPVDAVA
jgi:hypothetical protein